MYTAERIHNTRTDEVVYIRKYNSLISNDKHCLYTMFVLLFIRFNLRRSNKFDSDEYMQGNMNRK